MATTIEKRRAATPSARPCPDGPWLWGILLGFPMFMTGGVLMLTLIGAPLGIPLFHAGLGLMLSSKPCRG